MPNAILFSHQFSNQNNSTVLWDNVLASSTDGYNTVKYFCLWYEDFLKKKLNFLSVDF